jgi:hypothetical protein
MKIAVYSCNFGNYRNEFQYYYNVNFDDKIDYFLFTDKKCTNEEILKLKKWNINICELLDSDGIMNNFRWTAKYVKFILPEQLKDYDIIVWIDNKRFKKNDKMNNISYEQINKIINRYPDSNIFNIKHQQRKTMQEELIITMKMNLENKEHGENFLHYIKNYTSSFLLPDTCVIIKKNIPIVNKALEECFHSMKTWKLKRDQNIYNYVLDNQKITPILLDNNLNFI